MEDMITPLSKGLIKDMNIRGMGDKAQKAQIRAIADFAGFLGRSPEAATPEDLRGDQNELHEALGPETHVPRFRPSAAGL